MQLFSNCTKHIEHILFFRFLIDLILQGRRPVIDLTLFLKGPPCSTAFSLLGAQATALKFLQQYARAVSCTTLIIVVHHEVCYLAGPKNVKC